MYILMVAIYTQVFLIMFLPLQNDFPQEAPQMSPGRPSGSYTKQSPIEFGNIRT